MALPNSVETDWTGWLIDQLGGREEEVCAALATALEVRNIPKCKVRVGTVNMWWRRDSRCIDVTSNMDGDITVTVHVQEYGTSLFVGRAVATWKQRNYYKRMASSAFLLTVDGCIEEALEVIAGRASMHSLKDAAKGE
ncbi:MAG: hypothetical protein ACKVT1_08525 [Dehalococcoidia bacterium]